MTTCVVEINVMILHSRMRNATPSLNVADQGLLTRSQPVRDEHDADEAEEHEARSFIVGMMGR